MQNDEQNKPEATSQQPEGGADNYNANGQGMTVKEPDSNHSDKGNVPVAGGVKEIGNFDGKWKENSIWLDMLALIGVFVVANLLGGMVKLIVEKWAHADPGFGTFAAYVTAFGLTIAFALWQRLHRGASKPLLRFLMKQINPGLILWGVLLVIVTSVVLEPLLNIFPAEYLEKLQETIGMGGWSIMTSIVMAPILEEVLFRGIVQQSLTDKLGGWRGVLAASAIFGIVHFIPQQMINAFFVGIILGFIYIKTNSLVPVILIHAINNAIAFIQMMVFGKNGLMTVREVVSNDVLYWIVYGVFCVIFVIAAVNLWQQMKKLPGKVIARQ